MHSRGRSRALVIALFLLPQRGAACYLVVVVAAILGSPRRILVAYALHGFARILHRDGLHKIVQRRLEDVLLRLHMLVWRS